MYVIDAQPIIQKNVILNNLQIILNGIMANNRRFKYPKV
jgi:hypothetical protein